MSLYRKLHDSFLHWLTKEPPPTEIAPFDYNRLKYEIRPGDVLLIEGKSRVSNIIRTITQSPWTHAALYIGRLHDIENDELRSILEHHMRHFKKKERMRLIIEGVLGQGNIVSPMNVYREQHIRVCRPIGISPEDVDRVLAFTIRSLGQPYNFRQLMDLARFLLPWSILPRRWGSSLFKTPTGEPESGICSSLIAEAFNSVMFPILPYIQSDKNTGVELIPRNTHLFTPKDFDYSPYFAIIKYPIFNPDEPIPYYRRLPWSQRGVIHQDHGIFTLPKSDDKKDK